MASTKMTEQALQAMLNGPAEAPPPGVTPNFHDPSSISNYSILVLVLGLTFSTLAILLRTYTKIFLTRTREYEDYVVLVAWLGTIVQVFPYVKTSQYGAGVHIWDIPLSSFSHLIYWTSVAGDVYVPVIFLIKLSILLQYLRIFAPTRKDNMFIAVGIYFSILVNLIVYSVLVFSTIFACSPREKAWMPWIDGRCLDVNAVWKSTGMFNCISDFAILVLPIPSVWKLQIPLRKKMQVSAVFATGFCACIAAVVRTYYTWVVTENADFSYNIILFGAWTYAELAIGIIISCLPVLPRFFQHFGPKIRNRLSFSTASKTHSGFGRPFSSAPSSQSTTAIAASTRKFPFTEKIDRSIVSNEDGERIELKRQYVTLDEEEWRADDVIMGEENGRCGAGLEEGLKHERAGMGTVLHEGNRGIRVKRTTRVDTMPKNEEEHGNSIGVVAGGWT